MAESIFGDKTIIPNEVTLTEALKDCKAIWNEVIELSRGNGEWKFYSKAAGWSYPVKQNKRTLLYMLPKDGYFRLTFVFGERAVEAAKSAGLPKQILNDLLQATAYVEGRSVNVDIKDRSDMDVIKTLLQIKDGY